MMKKYEGLFILNLSGRDEGLKEAVDMISAEIAQVGGTVENVQKMDKRSFVRTPNKQMTSGYYVNIIFSEPPSAPAELRGRFTLNEYVYRVLFTLASETQAAAEPAA